MQAEACSHTVNCSTVPRVSLDCDYCQSDNLLTVTLNTSGYLWDIQEVSWVHAVFATEAGTQPLSEQWCAPESDLPAGHKPDLSSVRST